MVVTVFRNRLRPDADPEYSETAGRMSALAASMPGYLSHKVFTAADGERVTIVEFADEASQRAWAAHAEHRAAQMQGRERFYAEYRLQVCSVVREHAFPRK